MIDWSEAAFVGVFTALSVALVHLVFNALIGRARRTLGPAAGPKIAALTKQKGQSMMVAAIVPVAVIGGLAHSGLSGKAFSWREYTSDTGAYIADMPGEPVLRQQALPTESGGSVDLHFAMVDLGRNGSYALVDLDGPPLTYESGDRGDLMNANNKAVQAAQAVTDRVDYIYPPAWGEVPCTETHGHFAKDSEHLILVRSWRTGAHTYSAIVAYRADDQAAVQRFLDSVRPSGPYQKPGPNHT